MSKIEARIEELGITLPEASAPVGNYVGAKVVGNMVYLSGNGPLGNADSAFKGKVGSDFSLKEGYAAARSTMINLLGTLGFILPLVGFLGTVLGMMKTFQVVGASEYLSTADIAGAVNMALITTAAALVVAIPAYLGYNYLIARVNSITLDMEKASLEIIAFFERRRAETGGEEQ